MARNPIWKPAILECLKNESQTYEKLYESLIIELKNRKHIEVDRKEMGRGKKYNINYIEGVMKLLDEGKIKISGYLPKNSGNDRIQSFRPDNLILGIIKTDQWDILSLLDDLESSNLDEVNKAYGKLKNLFIYKFREFKKIEEDKWNGLKKRVKSKTIIEWIGYLEFRIKKIKNESDYKKWELENPDTIGVPVKYKIIINLEKDLNYYKELIKDSRHAKIWYIDNLDENEIHWQLKIHDMETGIKTIYYPDELKKIISRRMKEQLDINGKFDINDETCSEIILENAGFIKPKKEEIHEIYKRFRDVILYINSIENNKFLKNSFSLALSNEKDAMEWFEYFINISNISPLKQRISEEIPTYNDPNAKKADEYRKKMNLRGTF